MLILGNGWYELVANNTYWANKSDLVMATLTGNVKKVANIQIQNNKTEKKSISVREIENSYENSYEKLEKVQFLNHLNFFFYCYRFFFLPSSLY